MAVIKRKRNTFIDFTGKLSNWNSLRFDFNDKLSKWKYLPVNQSSDNRI